MATKPDKVVIEITQEACKQLRSFLMYDREGTSEGYSDFIMKAINIRRIVAGLEADNAAQIAALQAEIDGLKLQIKARDIILAKIGIDPDRIKVEE